MRRCLVTGGAGFIGLHLAKRLLEREAEVVLVDLPTAFANQYDALARVAGRCHIIEHDLRTPLPPERLGGRIDAAFLLAGFLGVDNVLAAPERALTDNLLVLRSALAVCERLECERFCFASTSEMYDEAIRCGLGALPPSENTPIVLPPAYAPRSGYRIGKLAAEFLCQNTARATFMHGAIVRFHNIYGPRMGDRHAIPRFILSALRRADPFTIKGDQSRAYCHVDDAVSAMIAVTERAAAPSCPTFNIGNDATETANSALAQKITALAGYRPSIVVEPPPDGSPDRRLPDLAFIRAAVGYEPRVSLDIGLAETFDWYECHLPLSYA